MVGVVPLIGQQSLGVYVFYKIVGKGDAVALAW
jgi:hypothetical protein